MEREQVRRQKRKVTAQSCAWVAISLAVFGLFLSFYGIDWIRETDSYRIVFGMPRIDRFLHILISMAAAVFMLLPSQIKGRNRNTLLPAIGLLTVGAGIGSTDNLLLVIDGSVSDIPCLVFYIIEMILCASSFVRRGREEKVGKPLIAAFAAACIRIIYKIIAESLTLGWYVSTALSLLLVRLCVLAVSTVLLYIAVILTAFALNESTP